MEKSKEILIRHRANKRKQEKRRKNIQIYVGWFVVSVLYMYIGYMISLKF